MKPPVWMPGAAYARCRLPTGPVVNSRGFSVAPADPAEIDGLKIRAIGRGGGAARVNVATASASGRTSQKGPVAIRRRSQSLSGHRASILRKVTANTVRYNVGMGGATSEVSLVDVDHVAGLDDTVALRTPFDNLVADLAGNRYVISPGSVGEAARHGDGAKNGRVVEGWVLSGILHLAEDEERAIGLHLDADTGRHEHVLVH